MHFAMKNGQICFSLRKFLAISPAIQKIASDCGCDAAVHLDVQGKCWESVGISNRLWTSATPLCRDRQGAFSVTLGLAKGGGYLVKVGQRS